MIGIVLQQNSSETADFQGTGQPDSSKKTAGSSEKYAHVLQTTRLRSLRLLTGIYLARDPQLSIQLSASTSGVVRPNHEPPAAPLQTHSRQAPDRQLQREEASLKGCGRAGGLRSSYRLITCSLRRHNPQQTVRNGGLLVGC